MLALPYLLELDVRFFAAHVSLADRKGKSLRSVSNADVQNGLVEVRRPLRCSNSLLPPHRTSGQN